MTQTKELAQKTVPSDEHTLHQTEAELAHDPNLLLATIQHEAHSRANALYQKVGAVAVGAELQPSPTMNLLEATRRARAGDVEARRLIETNARTDYIERTIKAGHIMKVRQEISPTGRIIQHGQTAEEIQENTLRYANANPLIKKRTKAEAKNAYEIEGYLREGYLKDHYAVVVSLCPDLDDKTLDDLHFFSFTKSLVIQATTEENGGVTTESAFIAGVKQDGAARYDKDVAAEFGKQYGKNWQGKDDAQIISEVLLIPKVAMQNGAIDLVRQWDDIAGGTFFGQAKPRQDYLAFRKHAEQLERAMEPTIKQISNELIASSQQLATPADASKMLNKISAKHALDRAAVDKTIDVRVFGTKAALDVEEARFHYERGNHAQVNLALAQARKNETSGSCPSGVTSLEEESIYNEDGTLKTPEQLNIEREEQTTELSDKYGTRKLVCKTCSHVTIRPVANSPKDFVHECSHCHTSFMCGSEAKRTKTTHETRNKPIGELIAPAFWQKNTQKEYAFSA